MKKMNKILISGVAGLMIATNLVGATACSFGGTNDSAPNSDPVNVVAYDGSKVEVTFYHTMGASLQEVLNAHIEEFNKLYPNITIKHSTQGGYDELLSQINTELEAGNSPSLAYCYADHVAEYRMTGQVISLDDYINASTLNVSRADGTTETMGFTQAQLDDFVDTYYNMGKNFGDNKMYMLPFSKSTEVLFYNKTYFDKHNLTAPKTWDEMEALCARILEIDNANGTNLNATTGKTSTIPLGYDSEANWFITMCEQYGSPYTSAEEGKNFLFNNDTNKAFMKEFKEWFDKGYVTTKECYGKYTSNLFVAEQGYMTIGSTGGTGYNIPGLSEGSGDKAAFEVAIAPIPQVSTDASKHKVISQGPSVCLFKKSEQETAAAWLFAKYLSTSAEFQAEFSMTSGYAPVIESVMNVEAYAEFIAEANSGNAGLKAASVLQSIKLRDICYESPAFNGSSQARTQVGLLMQDIFAYKLKAGESIDTVIADKFDTAISNLEYFFG